MVWSIQVHGNTMLRRKDLSNGLREAIVNVHGKGYKAIFKRSNHRVNHKVRGEVICKAAKAQAQGRIYRMAQSP